MSQRRILPANTIYLFAPHLVDRWGQQGILIRMDDIAIEAMSLTDGADIHCIAGIVAMYRALIRERLDASQLEHELRSYVTRKRLERLCFSAMNLTADRAIGGWE